MAGRNLKGTKRVVVKVGSSSITGTGGEPDAGRLAGLAGQVAALKGNGTEVLLVSSGAVAAGVGRLGLAARPSTIPEKQACAAVGQGIIMQVYEKLFSGHGLIAGQVLLTRGDLADRGRFLNARNTLNTLLHLGVVPVINENDTVAVEEINFGDNDFLSALVAGLVDADLLCLLTDIDGFYTADPRVDAGARLIPTVAAITPELESSAGGPGTTRGSGGMASKLAAARVAVQCGTAVVVAHSRERDVLPRILAGEELGTFFRPGATRLEHRKRWIAHGAPAAGRVEVDGGAVRALVRGGKSLLPSGVLGVEGCFEAGTTVGIFGADGREVARGIVNFNSRELTMIKGRQTGEIEGLLGHKDYDEVVHRNNMVLMTRVPGG
ncbi:MAG: glutamate 5-kinase [Peptococcaceae bacterium]|jgi:glutamate 5-kinase|nr:glutamate 5-kinase [Peptococcaceae bacterium]